MHLTNGDGDFSAVAAAEQSGVEISDTTGGLDEALDAMGPLEGALQGMGHLESALQSLGPLEALQAIPQLDASFHGMNLSQKLSMVEYYSLTDNNQSTPTTLQCDRNAMQTLNPIAVLQRLQDQPELIDIVLETDSQQKDLLDSMLFNQLTPSTHTPLQLAQATQTQPHHHHHHIIQGMHY